jgi:hypothetical protein
MTVLTEAGPKPAVPRRRQFLRLRMLLVLAAVIVIAAGLTTWLMLRSLDNDYGPIYPGPFGALNSQRNWVFSHHEPALRLSAEPGATAQLIESVENQGSHSVKVTSIDGDDSVVRIQWSTYRVPPGSPGAGVDTRWHSFPAIVPAHGQVRMLITIHRPPLCPAIGRSNGAHLYLSDTYQVHWESLLGSHTTSITGAYGADDSVRLC